MAVSDDYKGKGRMVSLLSLRREKKTNKMKRFKVVEILRMLRNDGWIMTTQRGSHRQFVHASKQGKVTVNGQSSDTLSQEILNSIFKQAGWK